jgi:hypothetical protein
MIVWQPERRHEKSATEKKLDFLQQRRQELEGDPADVLRCTAITMPARLKSPPEAGVMDGNSMDVDLGDDISPLVDSSVLIKKLKGDDDTPLMTEAMRSLQKAQKELVYSRVLIKIR